MLALEVSLAGATAAEGSTWRAQPAAVPAGAEGRAWLAAVSCPSVSVCVAVGGTFTSSGGEDQALIERWDGAAWRIQATPVPRFSVLSGVSCVSGRACTAVGSFFGGPGFTTVRPLVEHWNGSGWSMQHFVLAPRQAAQLQGVSCRSHLGCVAVGAFWRQDNSPYSLVARPGHRGWTVQRAPQRQPELTGISCSSATDCLAVGQSGSGLRFDGQRWQIEHIPDATDGTPDLASVSCTSASSCVAVGDASEPCGDCSDFPVGAIFNGHGWQIREPVPALPPGTLGFGAPLSAVDCASPASCMAVGELQAYPDDGGLVERWNGRRWTDRRTPHALHGMHLKGVSCPGPSNCTAVGYTGSGPGEPSNNTTPTAARYR